MYTNILFDLDGTLTDSGKGIINSVCYAVEKMELPQLSKEQLRMFIGPPLADSFQKYFHLNEKDALVAVENYREYYRETGLYENELYAGIPDLLEELKKQGRHLFVATSKPEKFAKEILAHFQMDSFFDGIYGATMDGKRSKKGDIIHYALENSGIKQETAIMVGDREHDVFGAHENDMEAIGVLYGYGSLEELTAAGAVFIAQAPHDISNWLKQL